MKNQLKEKKDLLDEILKEVKYNFPIKNNLCQVSSNKKAHVEYGKEIIKNKISDSIQFDYCLNEEELEYVVMEYVGK